MYIVKCRYENIEYKEEKSIHIYYYIVRKNKIKAIGLRIIEYLISLRFFENNSSCQLFGRKE